MAETEWIQTHAPKALARIVPRLQHDMEKEGYWDPDQWPIFAERLGRQWQRIFTLLHHLYGWQYDFFFHIRRFYPNHQYLLQKH